MQRLACVALLEVILGVSGRSLVSPDLQCGLDPKLTANNFGDYVEEIGNIFGAACGRNRGIFVIEPADGHTYNCAAFPAKWDVKDANAVKKADPAVAVTVLSNFIKSVYMSSPEYVRARDPGACDFEAFSTLTCGKELPWQAAPWAARLAGAPIRGVNLGGLFILTSWVTPALLDWGDRTGITDHWTFSKRCAALGICRLYQEHIDTFYTTVDYVQMKTMGINTIRIPVGFWLFEGLTGGNSGYILPLAHILDFTHPLTQAVSVASSLGLMVILDVEPVDTDLYTDAQVISITVATATAVGSYVKHLTTDFSLSNVILLEIGSDLPANSDGELTRDALDGIRASSQVPLLLLENSVLPRATQGGSAGKADNVFINTKVCHDSEGCLCVCVSVLVFPVSSMYPSNLM